MSISRWDPWDEMVSLREAMDSLLRESVVWPRMTARGTMGMPVDLRETDDAFELKATLPGVKPEDVKLTITGDTLQISAEMVEERTEGQEGQWLLRERRQGRVQRTVTLPTAIQADNAEATFEHGVLRVRMPKAETARMRSIPVKTAGGGSQQIETQSRTTS